MLSLVAHSILALVAISPLASFAHPLHEHRLAGRASAEVAATPGPGLAALFAGNKAFIAATEKTAPGLISKLATGGQKPETFVLSCVDSRVPVDLIMNALPGTFFTARNIANVAGASPVDNAGDSAATYAIEELGVKNLVVVGHYECGGVGAAMATPPPSNNKTASLFDTRVGGWISPVRELFLASTRPEIVAFRDAKKGLAVSEADLNVPDDAAFRALVEENVKRSVNNLVKDPVVAAAWRVELEKANAGTKGNVTRRAGNGPAAALQVHGWVYNTFTGEMIDLKVSQGFRGRV